MTFANLLTTIALIFFYEYSNDSSCNEKHHDEYDLLFPFSRSQSPLVFKKISLQKKDVYEVI